jgi:hypothetical protein
MVFRNWIKEPHAKPQSRKEKEVKDRAIDQRLLRRSSLRLCAFA